MTDLDRAKLIVLTVMCWCAFTFWREIASFVDYLARTWDVLL